MATQTEEKMYYAQISQTQRTGTLHDDQGTPVPSTVDELTVLDAWIYRSKATSNQWAQEHADNFVPSKGSNGWEITVDATVNLSDLVPGTDNVRVLGRIRSSV